MKSLASLFFMLLAGLISAQDTPFTLSEVIRVDSVSKDRLFVLAKQWVDSTYTSPQKVIQSEDKETATLAIKAAFVVHVTDGFEREGGIVEYSVIIQCKDGRYKLTLSNFIHHHGSSDLGDGGDLNRTRPSCSPLNLPKYYWHQIKEQATERRNSVVASVKRVVGFTPQKAENANW